ncbi:branched-chain amino acid ABC transporter permease [Rhizobium etli]|uniref:branched-chain amino acid ABC transporter permease n=1 Tax=Rhizobium etli TaxID=29449 RepID=UPI0003839F9F|nr:branched-chain amino acid ABC transporter permease [Rhizobium etli]AGS26571.1 high-affinity branched-chain amino acid ABC transporter permease protein [Rhizobium etli bv. mimosae str. Mim1]
MSTTTAAVTPAGIPDLHATKIREQTTSLVLLVALLAVAFLLSVLFSGLASTVTELMIRIVVVVGLYIFIGNSGVLSFGHISFMSVGAYGFIWLSCCTLPTVKPLYFPGLSEVLQNVALPVAQGTVGAAALAGFVALVAGAVLMRLSGTAASIATFALLAGQYALYKNWTNVTGGTASIANVPVFVTPLVGTVLAVLAVIVAWAHQVSKYGLMLRAARDEPTAAKASGVNIWRVRTIAFALSGTIVGLGGAMHAGFVGVVTADAFYLGMTFMTLAMLIVGGIGSLSGAVVGVVTLTAVTELLRRLEVGVPVGDMLFEMPRGLQEVGLGVAMILVLLFRPAGIMAGKELSLNLGFLRKRK